MPEIEYPSHEIEKDNFRDSQQTQIWMRNMESFEFIVLKKSNIALQLLCYCGFVKLLIFTSEHLASFFVETFIQTSRWNLFTQILKWKYLK